ncbi:hypothetical protein D3C73_1354570 [compost metagenome]
MHFRVLVPPQHRVGDKARIAAQLVFSGNVLDTFQDEAHEAVAFALDAVHHLDAIHRDITADVYAEGFGMRRVVGGFGRGDQQLGGHAADTGASGAIGAAFNNQRALARGFRGAISGQTGRAGADDSDIGMQSFHDWGSPCCG